MKTRRINNDNISKRELNKLTGKIITLLLEASKLSFANISTPIRTTPARGYKAIAFLHLSELLGTDVALCIFGYNDKDKEQANKLQRSYAIDAINNDVTMEAFSDMLRVYSRYNNTHR